MRKNKIVISDDDHIPKYIDDQLSAYEDLEDDVVASIDWLKVRIYQQLVRQQRRAAHIDTGIAERISLYRESSATLLLKLNIPNGYAADYIDSLVYKVIATDTKEAWSQKFRAFMEIVEDLHTKKLVDNRSLSQFYLKCYIRAFEIADSIKSKSVYLEIVLRYAEQSRSVQYNYFLPLFYLLDIKNELDTTDSIDSLKTKIKDTHNKKIGSSGNFVTENNLLAKNLYESSISLLNNNTEDINNNTLKSLGILWQNNVIPNEEHLLKMLSRALSIEIDSSGLMEGIDLIPQDYDETEEESGAIQDLERILASDEGPNVEVKLSMESGTLIKIAETICAFANGKGGLIVVGLVEKQYFTKALQGEDIRNYKVIAQSFILVGYKNFDRARTNLASHISQKCNLDGLSIDELYTITLQSINNRQVGIIHVRPYASINKQLLLYSGKPYRRYDNQTMEMNFSEVNSLMGKLFSAS